MHGGIGLRPMLGPLGLKVSFPAVTVIRRTARQIATATIRGLPEIVLQVMDWLVPRAALVSIMEISCDGDRFLL